MTGVYAIRRRADGKCYVGSAHHIAARWRGHRQMLAAGTHHAPYLQASWNKHGAAAHEFVVLDECSQEVLLAREQHYIDVLDSAFNVCRVAGSRRGTSQPRAAVEKVAAFNRGKTRDAETRARMSAWQKGQPKPYCRIAKSEEWRRKIGDAIRGQTRTAEQRANYGKHWVGRKHTDQTRAKMSAARAGKSKPLSERGLANIRAANKARTGSRASEQTRALLSMLNRGRQHSAETKEKMRAAACRRWAAAAKGVD